jgi:hypothetical protein
MHRHASNTDYRWAEGGTHFDKLREAPELDYAHQYATIHETGERLFKKD